MFPSATTSESAKITRTIVERHGGRLWAENNSDQGATFYFTVPVDDREGQLSEVEGSL